MLIERNVKYNSAKFQPILTRLGRKVVCHKGNSHKKFGFDCVVDAKLGSAEIYLCFICVCLSIFLKCFFSGSSFRN